jgi:hypothetical protein
MGRRDATPVLIATLLVIACAGSVHLLSASDIIGSGPASETALRLASACTVSGGGRSYTLEPGEYRPTHADSHGVFYAAPNGVVEARGGEQRRVPGGIHMPSAVGRYYSFYSLWVALWEGDFSKLPLSGDCMSSGHAPVFTRKGIEVRP